MQINLRKFARGKPCQVRIIGVCNHDTEKSVWAHCRLGGVAGMGQKPPDLCGAIACSDCHDVLDGRHTRDLTQLALESYWLHGMNRSMALVSKELGL